ncbi:MAG: KTSC domain-containing protein [Flavipsychrobacter sp.]|nr:KTSC domain-containing protein [Flavipsychrobacter sp.]
MRFFVGTTLIILLSMPSSVILAKEYFAERKVLRITFVSGLIYDYLDVPLEVYDEMKKATSKGTFLNTRIKGIYNFKRVQ